MDMTNMAFSFLGLILIVIGESSSLSSGLSQSGSTTTLVYVLLGLLVVTPLGMAGGNHAMRKCKGLPGMTVYFYENALRWAVCLFYLLFLIEDKSLGLSYLKNFSSEMWFILFLIGLSTCFA